MGKEVKIGLAVIGVLLCVFGGVLFFRLRREAPGTAQKVAAAKKDAKIKAEKKEPETPEKKQDDDRRGRFARKTARGMASNADSQAEPTDPQQAPTLDTSPYRDRSGGSRRGRYDEVLPAGGSNEIGQDETAPEDAATAGEAGQLSELSMPDDRFARRKGEGAFARDVFSQETVAEDERTEPGDVAEDEDQTPGGEPEGEGLAMEPALERPRRGERMIEGVPEESEPAETEGEAVRLSPLGEDKSEVRPAADDRHARRRYDQEQPGGDRFERAELDRNQLDRDRGEALQERELAGETDSAAGEPAAERPVERGSETDSYVVEPNDNFWRISQKVYGTGAYFKALEQHNRAQRGDPRLINVGDVLSVPPLAVLRENYPDLCPKPRNAPASRETVLTSSSVRGGRGSRTYTVAEGDTLFDIARHELGKASRWAEIYRLNREQLGDDFNYLSPGTQLVLPERDEQTDPIASRPRRDGYQR